MGEVPLSKAHTAHQLPQQLTAHCSGLVYFTSVCMRVTNSLMGCMQIKSVAYSIYYTIPSIVPFNNFKLVILYICRTNENVTTNSFAQTSHC